MTQTARASRSVDVFADVVVTSATGRLSISGDGRSIEVSSDSWHAYRAVAAGLRARSRNERHRSLSRLRRILRRAGLELSFQVRGREIARASGKRRVGLVSRGLALPGLRIRFGSILRALFRSPHRSGPPG